MPQSFVAKFEGREQRLDLVEFVTIAEALDAPLKLLKAFLRDRGRERCSPKPRFDGYHSHHIDATKVFPTFRLVQPADGACRSQVLAIHPGKW